MEKIIACLDSPVSKKLKNAGYISIGGKENLTILPLEKSCIINFVKNKYPVETVDVILKDKTIIVSTRTLYCEFKEAEHRSNHQYIVIDSVGSRRKCHDEICKGKETNPVIFTNFPEQMKGVVKKYTGGEEATKTLVIEAEKKSTKYVKHYFDKEIQPMIYSSDRQLFTALATNKCRISIEECSCKESQIEHQLSGTSYLLTCSICKANVPMPIDCKFTKVINFQDNYNQIIAGGAINEVQEFSCDVSLDPNCGTGELTNIYNQILDGHKTAKISELLSKMDSNFVYAHGEYFNFNGSIWKLDRESFFFYIKCFRTYAGFWYNQNLLRVSSSY